MKKLFGLIGYPLSHSFSKKYFHDKFLRENIKDCEYELFEISDIQLVKRIFKRQNLHGLNVTIPYKHDIMRYMDNLDHSANKVGAVNVVKIAPDGKRMGFNSDYYGFKISLENWLPNTKNLKALILGTGGASKAVIAVLNDLLIPYKRISRDPQKGDLSYEKLKYHPEILNEHKLIINTTPLGMAPHTTAIPEIDYVQLNVGYYLYDLIYNPNETQFLKKGIEQGAQTKNGIEMLELQAEKSWEIWNA